MFTNFNFSLADLNINERLQQIKNDLEANIESSLGIDHAALAALTGDGDKGAYMVWRTICFPLWYYITHL